MKASNRDTALVVIDPQNDVLSEKGVSWALVGESVKENNTVENLGAALSRPRRNGTSRSSSRRTTCFRSTKRGSLAASSRR